MPAEAKPIKMKSSVFATGQRVPLVPAMGVKMITVTAYTENIQALLEKALKRKLNLKELSDKKDRVMAQVPKRRPNVRNFEEHDPRLEPIQRVILDKLDERLDPN